MLKEPNLVLASNLMRRSSHMLFSRGLYSAAPAFPPWLFPVPFSSSNGSSTNLSLLGPHDSYLKYMYDSYLGCSFICHKDLCLWCPFAKLCVHTAHLRVFSTGVFLITPYTNVQNIHMCTQHTCALTHTH